MCLTLSRYIQILFVAWTCLLMEGNGNVIYATYWADRGNRMEGVISTKEVAGSYFHLLGVQVRDQGELLKSASHLKISFWLPSQEDVSIRVWEPKTNYWMVPHRKNFPSGNQSFRWPTASVVRPLDLDPTKLYMLVTNRTETLYFPAQLFTDGKLAPKTGYRFVFESRGGVELNGTIAQEVGTKQIPVTRCSSFFGLTKPLE